MPDVRIGMNRKSKALVIDVLIRSGYIIREADFPTSKGKRRQNDRVPPKSLNVNGGYSIFAIACRSHNV